MKFRKHSGIYTLEVEQELSIPIEKAWIFFSNPSNLSNITPEGMGFKITSEENRKMYPGQIITYVIGLFPGVKSSWVTEITQVNEKKFFIDEQRFGPYKMWHHEHHFMEVNSHVKMIDKISYKLPFGFLGRWAHDILIKPRLMNIFNYRTQVLKKHFN